MLRESFSLVPGGLERCIQVADRSFKSTLQTASQSSDFALAWWKAFLLGAQANADAQRGELKIVDLFSGCGGLSVGLREAARALGFEPHFRAAVDVDAEALCVFRHNLAADQLINCSVTSLVDFHIFGRGQNAEFAYPPEVIDERMEALRGKVDIICAGPPCQGYSNLNNHTRRDHPRNLLYLAVPALAAALDVPMLLIENVPEVLQDRVYAVVPTTIALLQRSGYVVSHGKLSAHELGWPQTRKRYFLVASKMHVPVSLDSIRRAWARPPVGVMWAIDDLLDRPPTSIMDSVPLLTDENRQRIDYLFKSGEYELPDAIRPDCHKEGHSYPSVYGRLRENDPAGTITTGFLSPGRGRFIHPLRPRVLTPREAARIQGFPDWFEFEVPGKGEPTRTALSKWIGDAVPSILGYVAGLATLGPLP